MPDKEDKYVCTLDSKSKEYAKKFLNEDDKNREAMVNTFRTWIQQQKHISCPTDTKFLLSFLRTAKFSQLEARKKIEKFLSLKKYMKNKHTDIDLGHEDVVKFLKTGYMVELPNRDKDGRKVILYRMGAFKTSEWEHKKDYMIHALVGALLWLIHDEQTQVHGFVFVLDLSDFTFGHQTFWTMQDIVGNTRFYQGHFPLRHKGFHCYNGGPAFDALLGIARQFMSQKLKDRFYMHGSNLQNLYDSIPIEILPLEYIPDDAEGSGLTVDQMVDIMVAKLLKPEAVEWVKYVTSSEWKITETVATDQVQASFTKLNVD